MLVRIRSAGYYCHAAGCSNPPSIPSRVKRTSTALAGLILSVLVPTLRSGQASAQNVGYGPLALTLPTSARTLAMGDIGVASRDDDVIFYNPAQLSVARGTSFSL